MAQRISLPLTVSCFSKIQIGFTFLVPAHPGSPGQRAVKLCVCVLQAGGGGVGAARVSRATLHVSVESSNLHAPSLSVRHLPSVTEQGAVGTVYAIVTAHDRDLGRAGLLDTVSVVEGDPDGQFAVRRGVDDDEGEYTLEVVRSLDREQHRDGFNLTLAAVDRGRPPRTGTAQVPDGWLCGVALERIYTVFHRQGKKGSPYSVTKADPGSWQSACR